MNDDTTLVVYRSAMYLYYTGTSTTITECGATLDQDITEMSDPRVTQQLMLCQDYGFYPTVEFRL